MYLIDKIEEEDGKQEQILNRIVLKSLLETLEEQEKEVIVRRYYENQTQTQIAKDLHISQVQVSRLEKRILKRLREKMRE